MRGKKASIVGSPWVILMSFILVILAFLIFFSFFGIQNNHQEYVINKAKYEVGDNLFLLGLLRFEVVGEDKQLSELIVLYEHNNKDDVLKNKISSHVDDLMIMVFKKNVCWKLTINTLPSLTNSYSCTGVGSEEDIHAKSTIPGFNHKTISLEFTTNV